MDENSTELMKMVDNNKVIGTLPFDKEVFRACLSGERVTAVREMVPIADKLLAA